MKIKKIGMFLLAAPVFAVGLLAPGSNADAGIFDHSETVCVPYQQTDQKCTQTFYDADGNVVGSTVYYIDSNGMAYLLPYP